MYIMFLFGIMMLSVEPGPQFLLLLQQITTLPVYLLLSNSNAHGWNHSAFTESPKPFNNLSCAKK